MATNDLTITQISTVLNEIVGQATGQKVLAPLDGSQFATVAQLGLNTGYDNIINSISQVLSRTIFSVRPYMPKFAPLMVSTQRYGNIVRKLSPIDTDWEDDNSLKAVDGATVDMYKVHAPKALQTNFYGQQTYERSLTRYLMQLDTAFSSAEEFGQFYSMMTSNVSDMIAQAHENLARALVANFIAAKISANNGVVHLLTEYNTQSGLALTATSVYQPENFPSFMKFAAARIKSIKSMMTERTVPIWHMNITGKEVARHTPYNRQKMLIYAPTQFQMETSVLSDLFHDDYVRLGDNEAVNFWQSATTPDKINVKPIYMDADGALKQPEAAVEQDKIFGVIFDDEALGMTSIFQNALTTPLNASGQYYNTFWHFFDRYWTDFTENGAVLLLD